MTNPMYLRLISCYSLLLFPISECFVWKIQSGCSLSNVVFPTQQRQLRLHYDSTSTAPYSTLLKAVDDEKGDSESKLRRLGYTDEQIKRSQQSRESIRNSENLNVRVNLLPDIDPVTLTTLGFALIAFNFFVLGNLEDGGIAGIIATIINTVSQ
jgi:hypothetical protein